MVCFIGHRKVENKEIVKEKVKEVVGRLIVENDVRIFHFGSRSEFDDVCHSIVTDFQKIYPDIIRVNYNCKSEYVVKKDERERLEKEWSKLLKEEVKLKDYERGKISDRVYSAGKASYVERNEEMIDDSTYCVFFYREGYKPTPNNPRQSSKTSGTKLAYDYAVQKKKAIINIADEVSNDG